MKQWEKYASKVSKVRGQKVTLSVYDKVLMSTELVLDDQGRLREGNHVHRENEVRREGVRGGGGIRCEMRLREDARAGGERWVGG